VNKAVGTIAVATVLIIAISAFAADRVVVVPLGGAVGDAVASDVVKGKTFSSKAGKGMTGTLERHPMAQKFVTPWYLMTFNLIPAGSFIMGSPADEAGRGTDEGPQGSSVTLFMCR
jgi:tetrahydromethanopterin S-methyltransferase subunit D